MSDNYDPWEAAQEAEVPPSMYFGQVTFDVWGCVPTKGAGLVQFSAQHHKPEQLRTAVHIVIIPLPSSNFVYDTERKLLAESKEWAGQTLPSIKALGVQAKDLHEKYVKYELVPTGRTWTNDSGVEKVLTYVKFLAVYGTLEEAEKAAAELYGGGNGDSEAKPASDDEARKAALLPFVALMVKNANGDRNELAKLLASDPVTKDTFTTDSPEVEALLVEAEEAVPF